MKHPWWHWFFTRTISWGTETVMCPGRRPVMDFYEEYCGICKKHHRVEKWREYA